MKFSKTVSSLIVVITLMLSQNVVKAEDSIPIWVWGPYKEAQTKKVEVDSEIKLAESTKLAFDILKKQLEDKKKELGNAQDQLAYNEVSQKEKNKKDLEKIEIIKKQIHEIGGRLDTVVLIDSLGVKNLEELDAKIVELKSESEKLNSDITNMKKRLVLSDSRFSKFDKVYTRKLEVERQEKVLETMANALDHQNEREGGGQLLAMTGFLTLGVKFFMIDEERMGPVSKSVWATATAALVYGGWLVYDSSKQIKILKKDIELKQKAYQVDYDELSEQFDIYSTVLGLK